MNRNAIFFLIGISVLFNTSALWAAAEEVKPTNANSPTAPSNDSTNYFGDILSWPNVIYYKNTLTDALNNDKCIPAGIEVIGNSPTLDTDNSHNNTKWLKVRPESDVMPVKGSCIVADTLPKDKNIYISADDAGTAFRRGLDFGALVVPFKLYLAGKKNFTGSASVAPYLGYRIPYSRLRISFNPIVFLGASNISVTQNVNGKDTTQSLAAISYGFGITSTIKSSFQLGVVFGFDHVNDSSNYQMNDKLWVAAQIGYSFMN